MAWMRICIFHSHHINSDVLQTVYANSVTVCLKRSMERMSADLFMHVNGADNQLCHTESLIRFSKISRMHENLVVCYTMSNI